MRVDRRETGQPGRNEQGGAEAMKWLVAMLVMIGVVWFVAKKTSLLDQVVSKDATNAEAVMPKAERAAARERARVNQVQSVESAAAGETVSVTMSQDEVHSIWGEPDSIEKDRNGTETWRYESIGKKVVFRYGRVWSVDPL
jgi:hypothetical protein